MSTIKVTNIQSPDSGTNDIIIDANGHVTIDGVQLPSSGPLSGARNRIINGDMRIDQRNSGASVTPTDGAYTLDRWQANVSQASKLTIQQSSVAPAGFDNSLLVTSSSAYSVGSTDYFYIRQNIEGYNFSDFGFGASGAKTLTISFWVRSSLTGTFGGALNNGAGNRNYPFTYAINAADTWEHKVITVAGDTTGTWLTTNGKGLSLSLGLGVGSTYSGASGSWSSTLYLSATGATSVVGTNSATFYITGVQLEAGSIATQFERRSYGQELALCQRYFQRIANGSGQAASTGAWESYFQYPITMRATPTCSLTAAAKIEDHANATFTQSSASVTLANSSSEGTKLICINFSGLTATRYYSFAGTTSGAGVLQFSAEL